IYAVNEYGTPLNIDIPREKALGYEFEWSPDGQWIAHSHVNPSAGTVSDRDIYVIRAADSKVIRITNISGTADAPSWSPDGSQIAFHAYAPDANNRYRYGI